jgi:PAS domain S-box/diguanylate cyclase (GGDEF) domain
MRASYELTACWESGHEATPEFVLPGYIEPSNYPLAFPEGAISSSSRRRRALSNSATETCRALLQPLAYLVSVKTGRAFFDELITQLHRILGAQYVWVIEAESLSSRGMIARVLFSAGINSNHGFQRYGLDESPFMALFKPGSSPVWTGRDVALPAGLGIAAHCWSIALYDGRKEVIGHITITFPPESSPDLLSLADVQQLFAHRASAELERYRTEAQLRLAAVAFETNEGLVITDPDRVILRVNNAFSQITGYLPEQVVGLELGVSIWPWGGDTLLVLEKRGTWQGEVERLRADGSTYPQWETWSPVRDEYGDICHYVVCFEDLSERKEAAKKIRNLAYYDDLTGLPNRRFLLEQLDRAFVQTSSQDLVGALLFIDLDHFKTINDSLGHATGDWLLQQVAMRLGEHRRVCDFLARLGGDEFVVLLSMLASNPAQAEMQATLLAEQLIETLSIPYEYQGQMLHTGASIGISLFPCRGQTSADLLKQADTAMYQAKFSGRRTVRVFDLQMQKQADKRLLIHNQLRNALRNNELVLHYQPQHMVATGQLMGGEALLRWVHPERGMISPAEFIPIAEETDLIVDIGKWVLLDACRQYVQWAMAGYRLPQLSVNVSAKQFRHPDFVNHVSSALSITGMVPSALNLEITESVVVGNTEETISKMNELKALGLSFSIDDFGTGYSSLAYLKRLPVDELKIDRSFIQDIPQDESNMAIVEAVMAMASHLNFTVTAEGVETRQQLEFLQKQGCSFYQGYLASKPLSADAFLRYLARQHR